MRNIHSLANVVILFAIKTCQPCHYIKPIARVYTRECHENKNTRFWATYGTSNITWFIVHYWHDKITHFDVKLLKGFIQLLWRTILNVYIIFSLSTKILFLLISFSFFTSSSSGAIFFVLGILFVLAKLL